MKHQPPACAHEALIAAHRRIVEIVASTPNLDVAAPQVVALVAQVMEADGASLTRARGTEYEYLAGCGIAGALVGTRRPIEGSFTGSVITDREGRLFEITNAPAASQQRGNDDGIRSGVAVPIMVGKTVMGTLGVASHKPGFFDRDSVRRLDDIASFLGLGFVLADRQHLLDERAGQLEQSRERADQALLARTNFLNAVNHELRTPLTAILGYAQFGLDVTEDEELTDILHCIESAGRELLKVVETVEDLSRAGAAVSVRRNTDVRAAVMTLWETFGQAAESKGLQFRVTIDQSVPDKLSLDEKRITQILQHLLDNAVKFTHHGRITLNARLLRQSHPYLEFTVEDTGVGMTDAVLANAFDILTQGDMSGTRQYGGLGAGLALVKALLEPMDGTINVHSRPGEGSRFVVTVPVDIAIQS